MTPITSWKSCFPLSGLNKDLLRVPTVTVSSLTSPPSPRLLALSILWGEQDSLPFPSKLHKSGIPLLPFPLCNATCTAWMLTAGC